MSDWRRAKAGSAAQRRHVAWMPQPTMHSTDALAADVREDPDVNENHVETHSHIHADADARATARASWIFLGAASILTELAVLTALALLIYVNRTLS